jgi:hypothetical protein
MLFRPGRNPGVSHDPSSLYRRTRFHPRCEGPRRAHGRDRGTLPTQPMQFSLRSSSMNMGRGSRSIRRELSFSLAVRSVAARGVALF